MQMASSSLPAAHWCAATARSSRATMPFSRRGSTLAGDGSVRPGDGSAVSVTVRFLPPMGSARHSPVSRLPMAWLLRLPSLPGLTGNMLPGSIRVAGRAKSMSRAFSGGVWTAVGGQRARMAGISASVAASTQPSIALDGSGAVVVAWIEATGDGRTQVNVARYDSGTNQWRALAGSLSAGGISAWEALTGSTSSRRRVAWLPSGATRPAQRSPLCQALQWRSWVEIGAGSASVRPCDQHRPFRRLCDCD